MLYLSRRYRIYSVRARRIGSEELGLYQSLDGFDYRILAQEVNDLLRRMYVDIDILGSQLKGEIEEWMRVLGQVIRINLLNGFLDGRGFHPSICNGEVWLSVQ